MKLVDSSQRARKLPQAFIARERAKAEEFIGRAWGKRPLFILTIANTSTGEIPGLTVAGVDPKMTRYTPAADAELLEYGQCKSIQGVPATPDGKPTPALLTMVALKVASIPFFVVDAGVLAEPQLPHFCFRAASGGDIRHGSAMEPSAVKRSFSYGKVLGETLSSLCDYMVLGESIPGGTTTALAVLMAMGIDARGRMSSSLEENQVRSKNRVAEEALHCVGCVNPSVRSF